MKPDNTENESSQMDYPDESNPTPSDRPLVSHGNVKNDWINEATDEAADWSHTPYWPCHDPIFVTPNGLGAPPVLALLTGS